MYASKGDSKSKSGSVSGSLNKSLISEKRHEIKAPYEMNPKGVCLHNTGNNASASNEISYMKRNDEKISFHVAVDDKEAIQAIPFNRNAWHAGDKNGDGNRKYIGVEICHSTGDEGKFRKGELRAAAVVADLLSTYGGDLKAHRDFSTKDCPHKTSMKNFRSLVQKARSGVLSDDSGEGETAQKGLTGQEGVTASTYVVKSGDSLSKIATRFGVSGGYQALAKHNGIANPSRISVGQVIKIPSVSSSESSGQTSKKEAPPSSEQSAKQETAEKRETKPSAPVTYVVKSGDSLSKIATQFAVSGGYQALAKHNGIANPSRISVGQVIKIPGASSGQVTGQSSSKTGQSSSKTGQSSSKTGQEASGTSAPQSTDGVQWLGGGEAFKITHYTYALESDPKHNGSKKVKAPGLDKAYKDSFLNSGYGVRMQGTGRAEDGRFIMYDGTTSTGAYKFKYGVGGRYAEIKHPYAQIAVDPKEIKPRSKVLVELYKDKGLMSADDTGGAIKGKHIDVFVGAVPISVAYGLGTKRGRVGYAPDGQLKIDSQGAGSSGGGETSAPKAPTPDVSSQKAAGEEKKAEDKAPKTADKAEEVDKTPKTAGAVSYSESPTLKYRKTNRTAVTAMQQLIKNAGIDLGVDGDFGPTTLFKLMLYQFSRGLSIDGVCGPNTWKSLRSGKGAVMSPDTKKPFVGGKPSGTDASASVDIGGGAADEPYMQPKAAEHFNKMAGDFKKDKGTSLKVTSAFRTMRTAILYHSRCVSGVWAKGRAARPGHSKHQCGLAVDLADCGKNGGGSAWSWMQSNASKHKFKNTGWNFSYREGWHWEYRP